MLLKDDKEYGVLRKKIAGCVPYAFNYLMLEFELSCTDARNEILNTVKDAMDKEHRFLKDNGLI